MAINKVYAVMLETKKNIDSIFSQCKDNCISINTLNYTEKNISQKYIELNGSIWNANIAYSLFDVYDKNSNYPENTIILQKNNRVVVIVLSNLLDITSNRINELSKIIDSKI